MKRPISRALGLCSLLARSLQCSTCSETSPVQTSCHMPVWAVVQCLLGPLRPMPGMPLARSPPSLGGLGCLAAEQVAPATYTGCVDVLLADANDPPEAENRLVHELGGEPESPGSCAVAGAAHRLSGGGLWTRWTSRPDWVGCVARLWRAWLAATCRSRTPHFPSKNVSCFQPRVLAPSATPSPVRMPVCGLPRFLPMQHRPPHAPPHARCNEEPPSAALARKAATAVGLKTTSPAPHRFAAPVRTRLFAAWALTKHDEAAGMTNGYAHSDGPALSRERSPHQTSGPRMSMPGGACRPSAYIRVRALGRRGA